MSNAMRTGKRWLAGVAAGALGAGLLVGLTAGPAQANTYGITLEFPSVTLVQTALTAQQIDFSTELNGVTQAVSGTTVAATITNSSGATWVGSEDTRFSVGQTGPTSGLGTFALGTGNSAATFATIPTGIYTFSAVMVNSSTGVALASATMPIAVVSAASAGTIAGSATFLAGNTTSDLPSPTQLVNTGGTVSSQYAFFANSAGGAIIAPVAMYVGSASPTNGSGNVTTLTPSLSLAEPGVVTFANGASQTWAASPGAGAVVVNFADPVDQITGTRTITISSSATVTSAAIASAQKATYTGGGSGFTATANVPATNGVEFTISGVTQISSANAAGVPVTVSVQAANANGSTSGSPVAWSAISPATTQSLVSGTGGVFSQKFTVSNPVNAKSALVTVAVPGATATYVVQFITPAVAAVTAVPGSVTAANSGTVTVNALVTNQFGAPVANWPVRAAVSGVAATTTPAALATGADGLASYTITVPAGTASGAVSNVTWSVWNGSNYTSITPATATVTYTSGSSAVSAIAVQGAITGNATIYNAMTGNKINTTANPLFVNTAQDFTLAYTPAADGFTWKISGTATNAAGVALAGAPVTITPSTGAYVQSATTGKFVTTSTVFTDSTGKFTAVLTSSKTGEISWALTSGTVTTTVKAEYRNRPTDARAVAVSVSSAEVVAGGGTTITATVTDRFGNPVPETPVTFTESGPGYIGGSGFGTTGAEGKVEATLVTVTGQSGDSTVGATVSTSSSVLDMPKNAVSAAAQVYESQLLTMQVGNGAEIVTSYPVPTTSTTPATSYTIAGVTAGVRAANTPVKILPSRSDKSITIVGARTTVSGKPGIVIDGVVTGIENGKTVKPFFRFPGQTTFTEGSARPVIAGGSFEWQRKTGKKFYAYVTSDDGLVQSNRVTISAN